MKKFLAICLSLGIIGTYAVCSSNNRQVKSTDSYVRDRVVMLRGNHILCSGIQVKAPSGTVYTLTAAHCLKLVENGKTLSTDEYGNASTIYFVSIDEEHDLMLLSSANHKSINVADDIYTHQHIHTMTHGHGYPSYRTDGEILSEQVLKVMKFPILNEEDEKSCKVSSYQQKEDTIFGPVCVITMNLQMTSAYVVPGSSGGAVLNSAGELVGIVSCGDGSIFSGVVPLLDIQLFLANR